MFCALSVVSCFNSWHVHVDPGEASSASITIGSGVAGPSGLTNQTDHDQGMQLLTLLMWRLPNHVNKVIASNRKT